jgi:hypothetical protein
MGDHRECPECGDTEGMASAVMESSWLAAHDAQVRAEALAPIEALLAGLTASGAAYVGVEELLGDLRAALPAPEPTP